MILVGKTAKKENPTLPQTVPKELYLKTVPKEVLSDLEKFKVRKNILDPLSANPKNTKKLGPQIVKIRNL
jgi:hypothetical protein